MHRNKAFFLSLADGHSWCLTPAESAVRWIEKLAALMNLPASGPDSASTIIVTLRKPEPDGASGWRLPDEVVESHTLIPTTGWQSNDQGFVQLLTHPDARELVCRLGRQAHDEPLLPEMWKVLVPVYRGVLASGGLVAHSCLFSLRGLGVLLIGPSNMGKSTCARRLGAPWRALCDDEVLVVRVANGLYHGHPLPTWSDLHGARRGKVWDIQDHVPLRAMFFLDRNDINGIVTVGSGRATVLINKAAETMNLHNEPGLSLTEKRAMRSDLFENSCQLARSVPSFMLRANLTSRFWEEMAQVL